MHAEAMDDGPILICHDRSASAERSTTTAGLQRGQRRARSLRGQQDSSTTGPFVLPRLTVKGVRVQRRTQSRTHSLALASVGKRTEEPMKTKQTPAVPFSNNGGKP